MNLEKKREKIAKEISEHFAWYYEKGYITTRDGNACAFLDGDLEAGYFLVTASGVQKDALEPGDFITVTEKGEPTRPQRRKPSIETQGHLAAMKASGAKFSVHVHSPNSTAFYSMRKPLVYEWPELTRYTIVGETIPYLTPGSDYLHELIGNAFSEQQCDIVVLKNHGVLAVGNSLQQCKEHIMRLEHTADMWLKMLAAEGEE